MIEVIDTSIQGYEEQLGRDTNTLAQLQNAIQKTNERMVATKGAIEALKLLKENSSQSPECEITPPSTEEQG